MGREQGNLGGHSRRDGEPGVGGGQAEGCCVLGAGCGGGKSESARVEARWLCDNHMLYHLFTAFLISNPG